MLREQVEMHSRGVVVLRLCAYLVDRGVFEVNELSSKCGIGKLYFNFFKYACIYYICFFPV